MGHSRRELLYGAIKEDTRSLDNGSCDYCTVTGSMGSCLCLRNLVSTRDWVRTLLMLSLLAV